jgi:hypothetical protein
VDDLDEVRHRAQHRRHIRPITCWLKRELGDIVRLERPREIELDRQPLRGASRISMLPAPMFLLPAHAQLP